MAASNPSIRINGIKKSFGEKEVLKGIDFEFEEGKINMIIGASGSGKSVMLKCIVGLLTPDAGDVMYGDVNFHQGDHRDIRTIRTQMGMLFQYSALFDSYTVAENIGFPMKMFTDMSSADIKKRVEFCLERVNLLGVEQNFPAELSGGMQKRVGIARAIALNPKYLFVDEPNSGLDPLTASVIDELIQNLTTDFNMTTVVVSHDMNSVVNISDKIMFLHHGVKAWEGDKRTILRSGNESVDKFVFVSDLIRRDIYDNEPDNTPAIKITTPPPVPVPVTEDTSLTEIAEEEVTEFTVDPVEAIEGTQESTPEIEIVPPPLPEIELAEEELVVEQNLLETVPEEQTGELNETPEPLEIDADSNPDAHALSISQEEIQESELQSKISEQEPAPELESIADLPPLDPHIEAKVKPEEEKPAVEHPDWLKREIERREQSESDEIAEATEDSTSEETTLPSGDEISLKKKKKKKKKKKG